jgi:hypothetical protein
MKKLLLIGAPLVAIALVGGFFAGSFQAEELKKNCYNAGFSLGGLEVDISAGQLEARTYGGGGRFADGSVLVSAREQVGSIEVFSRLEREMWLAKLVGRQPKDVNSWISATAAARNYLTQLENASLNGDYSNAKNFGAELLAISREFNWSCEF